MKVFRLNLAVMAVIMVLTAACTINVDTERTEETGGSTVQYSTYTDPNFGFSFDYPSDWSMQTVDGSLVFEGPDYASFQVQVLLSEETGGTYGSLSEVKREFVSQMRGMSGYTSIDEKSSVLGGANSVVLENGYSLNGGPMRNTMVFSYSDGYYFVLTYAADSSVFDENKPVFERAVSSFSFGQTAGSVPKNLGGDAAQEKSLDEQCAEMYPNSHYDEGLETCWCDEGYVLVGGACVEDTQVSGGSAGEEGGVEEEDEMEGESGEDSTGEEEVVFSSTPCASLTETTLEVSSHYDDSKDNAKSIAMCSINHDVMNSVNKKFYEFTISSPTKVHLLVDGMAAGEWQVGVDDKSWGESDGEGPASYEVDLMPGTYIAWVSMSSSVSSTCTGSDCYFELQGEDTRWWIQGSETGTSKLNFRLVLSSSAVDSIGMSEVEGATGAGGACASFSQRDLDVTDHDTEEEAIAVSLCDTVSEVFHSNTKQYFKLELSEETDVRISLSKPEGRWQVVTDGYGWGESETMGQETFSYEGTLPAGEQIISVNVFNTAGIGGSDWTCREIVQDGTCWWSSGNPPEPYGKHLLEYTITFDRA